MAKKKKNRKTRKQKITQAQGKQTQANLVKSLDDAIDTPVKTKSSNKTPVTNTITSDELKRNAYTKKDIRRSLVLTGIILVVFAVIFIVLDKTSVGTQVYRIIKI